MPLIILVRHAKPAASWGQSADPGLDDAGIEQAAAAARHLAVNHAVLPVYTSPLLRCRETARPLESRWQRPAQVLPAVAEIPAPPLDLAARQDWLMQAMRGSWHDLQKSAPAGSPDYLGWRNALLESLASMPNDCVIYTHFIAINVVVGNSRKLDDVVCFRPDHASATIVETDATGWRVVELGREAQTTVLTR